MAVNNNGNLLDTSSNVAVDFVWGNMPMQPNDDRAAAVAPANIGGTTGTNQIQYQTAVVTAASASAGVVTYTAANSFQAGQTVSITGLSTGAFNLTNVIIGTVSTTQFTVTNAATGTAVTGATATASGVIGILPGVGADSYWAATTRVASGRLNVGTPAFNNHNIAEGEWASFPSYTAATGNYIVTAATGNGTTVTYTSQNKLTAGDVVNITGLYTSAFNLSSATVATANATSFTVTSAVGSGVTNTGQYAKVEATNAAASGDGAFVSGTAYIVVPSVLGETTALALDELLDAGYETANITNTTGVTNTATQPTQINVTTTTAATVTITGGTTSWPVGTKVTIAAGTGIPAAVVGTWYVTGGSGSTLVIAGTGWTVADTGAITPGTRLTGTTGTVRTQSTAAAAASVATTATITITSWA
jgi:hypothetical protein